MGCTIFLIRHAQPIAPGTPGEEENERRLSERGKRHAQAIADSLAGVPVEAVYSSPYPRALQTVSPIARSLGLGVGIIEDLRERLLSPEPLIKWPEHLRRSWNDFDYALPGGESSRIAQNRVKSVLEDVARRHPEETVVLGSHGNLVALALNANDSKIGYEFWAAMPLLAVYRLEKGRDASWRIVS